MDIFTRQAKAIADRWRSLTSGARLIVGLLAVVAIASIALLSMRHEHGAEMYLLAGEPVAADQLPRMEAAFAKAGLSDYQIDAGRVRIPRTRNTAYMAALAAADALPRNFGDILDRAVRQTNPLMNRAQQEEMIKSARQNELAAIIQKLKGVQQATVLFDREKKPGLAGGEHITASVTIEPRKNHSLRREQVVSIRKLVAGAIAGLDERNIAVIDLTSGHSFHGDLARETPAETAHADSKADEPPALSAAQPVTVNHVASVEPDPVLQAWNWAREHYAALSVGGVALVGLLLVRSLYRSVPQGAIPASNVHNLSLSGPASDLTPTVAVEPTRTLAPEPTPELDEPVTETAVMPAPQRMSTRLTSPAPHAAPDKATLRGDLAEIVRDDPHAAARVLRSWISSPN